MYTQIEDLIDKEEKRSLLSFEPAKEKDLEDSLLNTDSSQQLDQNLSSAVELISPFAYKEDFQSQDWTSFGLVKDAKLSRPVTERKIEAQTEVVRKKKPEGREDAVLYFLRRWRTPQTFVFFQLISADSLPHLPNIEDVLYEQVAGKLDVPSEFSDPLDEAAWKEKSEMEADLKMKAKNLWLTCEASIIDASVILQSFIFQK